MIQKPRPVHGTKEWAATSVNCITGCSNNCWYCYAKASAVRFRRKAPDDWEREERSPPDLLNKTYGKRQGTIMFPTTHDITMSNYRDCRTVLLSLLKPGNKVLIVSKPDPAVIYRLCKDLKNHKDQILFRFTIGSLWSETLKFWEPNAPSPESRLLGLRHAFREGFETSVSMEPILDKNHQDTRALVNLVDHWVTDAIWLGKMNNIEARLTLNGAPDHVRHEGQDLEASQTDLWIAALYNSLKGHPKVKWKESVKKVVGIPIPTEAGLDI